MEIERKFLVSAYKFPADLTVYESEVIRQGYVTPDARIRVVDNQYCTVTIKVGTPDPRVRHEFEFGISRDEALRYLDGPDRIKQVRKIRYKIPAGNGLTWEVDIFGDKQLPMLLGLSPDEYPRLIIAEIELPSPDTEFERPEWLGPEVTNDPRFKNANLVR